MNRTKEIRLCLLILWLIGWGFLYSHASYSFYSKSVSHTTTQKKSKTENHSSKQKYVRLDVCQPQKTQFFSSSFQINAGTDTSSANYTFIKYLFIGFNISQSFVPLIHLSHYDVVLSSKAP